MLGNTPKKGVRAFRRRNHRYRSRECPLEMTMSGDSGVAEARHAESACGICFVSSPVGMRQDGQKSATECSRQFGEYEWNRGGRSHAKSDVCRVFGVCVPAVCGRERGGTKARNLGSIRSLRSRERRSDG